MAWKYNAVMGVSEIHAQGGQAPGDQPSQFDWTKSRLKPITWNRILRSYPLLFIIIVSWIANYLHFTSFGYYEDDWYYYPAAFAHTPGTWFRVMFGIMKSFLQGRPLLVFFEAVGGYIGAAFSSISLPYAVAFVLLSARSVLLYYVLRRRFPHVFCSLTVLFSVLSPLTTMRQSLDTEFFLGPALILLFTSILIRRRSVFWNVMAYVLAALVLLTYESVFLLFLVAPLFERGRWNGRRLRSYAIHLTICAGLVVAFILVRHAMAEERILTASRVGIFELLKQIAAFDIRFSVLSFGTYLYATKVALREASLEAVLYTVGFFIVALVVYLRGASHRLAGKAGRSKLARARRLWWVRNGCAIGLLLVFVGHLTAYFQMSGNPGFPLVGRDTRFSATAVWGSSMFAASILILLLTISRSSVVRAAAQGFAIWCLSILFLYSFVIQDDYVRAWEYEKSFLSQAVLLTPDIRDDTLIVVRTVGQAQPGFGPTDRPASVCTQRHGVQVSLQCLSGRWFTAPRFFFVESGEWRNFLAFRGDGKLYWTRSLIPGAGVVNTSEPVPTRIILLREHEDGSLSRLQDAVTVAGKQLVQPLDAPDRKSMFHSHWPTLNPAGLLEHIVYGAARTVVKAGAPTEHQGGPEPPEGTSNIALEKPTRQSSTFGPFGPDRGVDGVKKIIGFAGFHTDYEQNPWWQVDLGHPYHIYQVRLYNGQKNLYQRAATVRVLLSVNGSDWTTVFDNMGRSFGPEPLIIGLDGPAAEHVRVQLAEANYLHLEEVEVFGK